MKENKGITLVALIITIIVLLILAVVTISAVNEGSLFSHANNAVDKYGKESEKENSMISNYIDKIAEYDGEENNDRILELMNAALNGDEAAGQEMEQIIRSNQDNMYIFEYKNDDYNPVYIFNGIYYKIDFQNQKAEILTSQNYPTLYEDVNNFKDDLDNIKTLFFGKNIEDFDQEETGEGYWRIYNLEGIFTNELTVHYSAPHEDNPASILFRYDLNQEFGQVMLILENSEIVNDKITGVIVSMYQDD